ncbi:PCI-domain-containing protein [Dichomitus squalens LYAD-421 SS1]|uniref:Eukaryotic translation initiation factor 3 subunit M n=1 Tax=Dichomitus squalens (strain LYAD-421) TaxID=732165 RepID=R7T2Y7_DICSQ|nr:PCI-domain-containing protein [Dichomitus squalens LYAD-421 SS1]EJF62277.1 PCI-domain-containing protein [Dichomitus squalens LYAD-421 SS1]
MAATDSISIFAEGTFEEQILELVNYLARALPEEGRPAYIQPFQESLATPEGQKPLDEDEERRRQIFGTVLPEVKGLGDGSEKEIEGFFNLLFSHFLVLYSLDEPSTHSQLATLLNTISASPDHTPVKYRILSNLFNALPRRSGLRLPIYQTLLELASVNDDIDVLGLSQTEVDKWLSEWEVTPEEKSSFIKLIVDAYKRSEQPVASYQYQLSYVRSLPPSSPEAQSAAIDAIASALRLPNNFDFDPLFRLDAVVAAKDHELFALLQIFLNDGLAQYQQWASSHPDALSKYELDSSQLERKIRLLTLASLGFQNVGRDIPYSVIASALQVEPSQVESWVIDVIRAGLVSGKLSQTAQTLHVNRAAARTFEREQWELLEKRLQAWKTGLASVLETVSASRKKVGPSAAAATPPEAVANGAAAPTGIETPAAAAQAAVA